MVIQKMQFDLTTVIIRWAVNTMLLFAIVKTIKGLNVSAQGMDGFLIMAAAAAVIGLLNTFIRPLIIFLTLPINVLSFGLFTLVINAVMFFVTGWLIKGFEVKSFLGAVIGSLLYSVFTMLTGAFIKPKNSDNNSIKAIYKIIDK